MTIIEHLQNIVKTQIISLTLLSFEDSIKVFEQISKTVAKNPLNIDDYSPQFISAYEVFITHNELLNPEFITLKKAA